MKTILFLHFISDVSSKIAATSDIPCTFASLQLILKVVHSISRSFAFFSFVAGLCIQEFFPEILPIIIGRGMFNHDLFVVV